MKKKNVVNKEADPVKAKKAKNRDNENLKKFRAEVARQNEVKAACAQYGITGAAAQALVEDRSLSGDILKAEAMAASPHAGPVSSPDNQGGVWGYGDHTDAEKFNNAMSHGIIIAAGIRPKDNAGKPAKLSAGHEDFVNLSSLELCRSFLAHIGVNTRTLNPRQIANAALGTDEFVETLETTINTVLLSGYMEKPAKHSAITQLVPANNYKDIRALRLESDWDLEKLLEDGKLPSKAIEESRESYRVHDHGARYSIKHHVFVNDELGAVMQALNRVVRRIPKLEDKDIFSYLVSNPNMSDGGPLISTARQTQVATPGALSKTTLSEGRALLAKQKDLTDAAAEAEDKTLLIGIDDLTTAQELLGATAQPNDSRVSIWQYLNPVWSGQISAGFYQFADPEEYPVIGFSRLKGDEAPYIETHQKFGTRGFEMAIVHTYGYGVVGSVGVVYTPAS